MDTADAPSTLVDGSLRQVGRFTCAAIGFGCWRLTGPDVGANVALIGGVLDRSEVPTLVDDADVYGLDWGGSGFGACETALGEVLRRQPSWRDRMVLATKGGIVPGVPYVSEPVALERACEASLRRLGVDHVDLYQVHRPDTFTHPARVAEALNRLRDRGLVAEVGVSNHTPPQTAALQAHLGFPLASTQPEWSVVHLDPMRDGTFDRCLEVGTTVLGWSPLAGGALATGQGVRPELLDTLDRLAARERVSRAAVAVAFALAHPVRAVVLLGTQRLDRFAEAAAGESIQLDRADVYSLVVASDGRPLP
jgi:predicted oxidoreductase